jgi:hypothetical protein
VPRLPRHPSVRARVTTVFTVLVVLLVSAGATAFVVEFSGGLHRSLRSALRQRAERIAHIASRGQSGPDGHLFSVAVADVGQSVTQLLGPQGSVLAGTGPAGRHALVDLAAQRRAARADVYRTSRLPDGERWLLLATRWPRSETLVTGAPLATVDAAVARASAAAALAAALAVAGAALSAWLITGWALRPVERLRAEAAELLRTESDRSLTVPPTGDELAALAATFNGLLSGWRHALNRQRELVAAASHELRTPLAALHTELELARTRTAGNTELDEALAHALDRSRRLARLASHLLLLAELDESEAQWLDQPAPVAPLVSAVLEDWRRRAGAGEVLLSLDVAGNPASAVAPERLRLVADNLLANAVRLAPAHSCAEVHIGVHGDRLVLGVSDSGPGFPPEFLPHAFERFSRPPGARSRSDGGSGLGLAIVRAVARSYGGEAHAANLARGGARVWVELPLGRRP